MSGARLVVRRADRPTLRRRLLNLAEVLEREERRTCDSTSDLSIIAPSEATRVDLVAMFRSALATCTSKGVVVETLGFDHGLVVVGDEDALARAVSRLVAMCVECTPVGTSLRARTTNDARSVTITLEHELRVGFDEECCCHYVEARRIFAAFGGSTAIKVDRARDAHVIEVRFSIVDEARLAGVRVLVVSDDDDRRRAIRDVLRTHGARTMGVRASDFASSASSFDPHVIIATSDGDGDGTVVASDSLVDAVEAAIAEPWS